jgi:hypothetical protein
VADTRKPQQEKDRDHPAIVPTPEGPTIPGTPLEPGTGHVQGPTAGGRFSGGMSAADVGGGGAGGDLDLPDITGRHSTEDLTRPEPPLSGTAPSPPGTVNDQRKK